MKAQNHPMQELLDPISVMAAAKRKTDDPLADFRRGKKVPATMTAADIEQTVQRGRDIIAGKNPATERGKKVLAAIKESQSLKSPREQMAATRRGLRSFPPARLVT